MTSSIIKNTTDITIQYERGFLSKLGSTWDNSSNSRKDVRRNNLFALSHRIANLKKCEKITYLLNKKKLILSPHCPETWRSFQAFNAISYNWATAIMWDNWTRIKTSARGSFLIWLDNWHHRLHSRHCRIEFPRLGELTAASVDKRLGAIIARLLHHYLIRLRMPFCARRHSISGRVHSHIEIYFGRSTVYGFLQSWGRGTATGERFELCWE